MKREISEPVRYSHLKYMAISPQHYLTSLADDRDTPAMRLGRLVDAYLFNAPMPKVWSGRRAGNDYKAFEELHGKRNIVTVEEYDAAQRMVDALTEHPRAMQRLRGLKLQEIDWRFAGRDCISHPDVLGCSTDKAAPGNIDYATDLKSSHSAAPGKFAVFAIQMLYHAQLAFYGEAVRAAGLGEVRNYYAVVVEQKPPHAVHTFRYTERAIEIGSKLCRLWMERLRVCEESNEWPAYGDAESEIDISEELELNFDNLNVLEEDDE